MEYDTIIIGMGIAGITAAIYASRKRMKYLIISKDFGGQVNIAGEIENYPGIVKTNWIEFAKKLEEQVKYNNIKINYESIQEIKTNRQEKQKSTTFTIKTNKKTYKTKTIIITTGARAKELNIPGEKEFKGRGVTYCAVCDAPLYKNKTVAVIGGGDSAFEAADYLHKIAKKIYIININPKPNAYAYLQEKIKKMKNTTMINNARTTKILGNKFVTGIEYETKGKYKTLNIQGVFIEIGRTPNTSFLTKIMKTDQHGHIIVDRNMQTSTPGIYAAGDCTDLHAYQFITAAGQGCTALLNTVKYLQKNS